MMIYRNGSVEVLKAIAAILSAAGFVVSGVVTPENEWVDGVSYIHTNAQAGDVMRAWKEARS